ncbi:MAG: Maf family protein [Acetobacteraceae bacterium]
MGLLQHEKPPLVLASGSATRARLLADAGLDFTVLPTGFDEGAERRRARQQGCSAAEAARLLATGKAAAAGRLHPDAMVVAADQILAFGETWLERPAGRTEATEQLRMLRGQEHLLASAVVCTGEGVVRFSHVSEARLRFRNYSDALIEAVLEADAPAIGSSVGSYRLEGPGILLCQEIFGDHSTILGLPMLPLLGFLREAGIVLG